jgi:hypothetical protein
MGGNEEASMVRSPFRHFTGVRRASLSFGLAVSGVLAGQLPAAAQIDWLQYFDNPAHTGVSNQETIINPGNVTTLTAQLHVSLGSIADGAPAFLAGVNTPSKGMIDVLFVTTKDGHIIALNAADLTTVWSQQAATGPNYTTSSPAVDPNRRFVYSYGLDGKVHKYAVGDGTEVTTGGWPEVATLKPSVEKSSTGLTIATTAGGTTYLYVGNGGYPGDQGDYQGHVTVINLATGAQNVFNSLCSNQAVHFALKPAMPDCSEVQSAVWSRPGVMFDPDTQKIYFATGNGPFTVASGGHEYGDSLIALNADGTGAGGLAVDSYTPLTFQHLQDADLDLGSTSVAILPPVPNSNIHHLGVQSGKDSEVRLLNLDQLSGSAGSGQAGGEVQVMSVPQGDVTLTAISTWTNPADGQVWAFLGNGSGLAGFKVTADGGGDPSLSTGWSNSVGGTSPILANGMLFYFEGGTITARDPTTGSQLWTDSSLGGRHWESPIVVLGHLYVTDENEAIWKYGPAVPSLNFFTVTPCRVFDTRTGSPLANGATLKVTVTGTCGIPSTAKAISGNLTIVGPTAPGSLIAAPQGVAPGTANIAFSAGETRANNAMISLTGNPLGNVGFTATLAGTTHLILDVNGYFQ